MDVFCTTATPAEVEEDAVVVFAPLEKGFLPVLVPLLPNGDDGNAAVAISVLLLLLLLLVVGLMNVVDVKLEVAVAELMPQLPVILLEVLLWED